MSGRCRFVNATLIDGTGTAPRPGSSIVVEDGRITAIATGAGEARDADDVVDLAGRYLLPGLWEVHAHLGDLLPDPHNLLETESLIDYAIRAGRNAMDALRSGITGIRADLMIKIEKVLKARKLTQAKAAELMGVSQPRVSDLLRGKIELFSSDALIDMLARLGLRVRLVASPTGSQKVA